MKTCYITTPIYYSSGNVHIGNSYSTIACDVFSRYHRLNGYDTFFLTGMDEHGQKIENAAKKQQKNPQSLVDEIAKSTEELWKNLNISNNDFIRTSEERHYRIVQAIFERLLAQGDIYLGEYEGDYCVPCEAFLTKTQLVNEKFCPDCGRETIKVKEESYFLNLKKYEKRLLQYIKEHPHFIQPETRKNEVISFIEQGLEDLCVSRTSFQWGIPVLSNPKHVIYVWIDALSNYLTALGYQSGNDELYRKYWLEGTKVFHIVGKDILRFHAIYWPIMLMALEVPLRFELIAHGWILMKEGKMSKSIGNVVYPMDVVNRYGLDPLRFYLIKEMSLGNDGVFTYERFIEKYNVDLANDLGNLVSRTISMVNKYQQGIVYKPTATYFSWDQEVEGKIADVIQTYQNDFNRFAFQDGLQEVWSLVGRANKYIDETIPWALAKDPNQQKALQSVLYRLLEMIRVVTIMIAPVMPDTAHIILEELGLDQTHLSFLELQYGAVDTMKVTEKPIVLFKRLDLEEEIKKYGI
ncbi:MAG: methionine--tRNA ligase [Bacilli bacterium]|jgi:methionyl-tRNA synthetase|nr:methionine--tRNA ligase [Bacilli bacterium]